ncbi:tetratricopeptide repeat protein [Anaerosolibacter carboniphilus]|nr:tetratricopeptide repeat protein [Anaerosolibacter carboniphilus]
MTGNPLIALVLVFFAYGLMDKLYFGFLPDFTKGIRANQQIKSNLKELTLNPQNAHAALTLGMLYFEKKKYREALNYFQHPKLEKDASASYHYYLGMTMMELKEIGLGKVSIEKALEMDPRVGYGLPYIYLLKNEMNQSIPDMNKIEDLEEKIERFGNTENLYRMGRAYRSLDNKEKAKEFFTKAIETYSYCPRGLKRLHRKWAILSRIYKGV